MSIKSKLIMKESKIEEGFSKLLYKPINFETIKNIFKNHFNTGKYYLSMHSAMIIHVKKVEITFMA
jgi:hypothetical protein